MTGTDISKRLAEVARQPNGGAAAAAILRRWLAAEQPFVGDAELRRFAELAPVPLIVDSFRCDIPFGTGGRRGRVGIGPNRINPRTLALTVAGHCEFLRATAAAPGSTGSATVVVANDTRVFTDINAAHTFMGPDWSLLGTSSRSLALLACQLYAVYGFETYLTAPKDHDAYMPTPELSFAIRELGAAGGLNVSASHNHPDDNGFKVYTPTGGQYCPPDDATLSRAVEQVELDAEIERLVARYSGGAAEIPADVHRAYISMYVDRAAAICATSKPVRADVPIVYTPLCGTGLANVGETLVESGYQVHVPPDQYPDGSFAPIPLRSPNPEIPGVTDPAIEFGASVGAELVLSTDPDADRLGAEVKLADGTWRHLTGNQIGAIIAYFLIADPEGPRLAGPLITTVATSRVLRAIAALGAGVSLTDDLMIGFKFIGQQLDTMEATTGHANLVLASEESHGYLTTTGLRDKDAASGGYIVAHLHALARSRGLTLWDYLMEVFAAVGVHIELGRSLVLLGADGAEKIKAVMRSLRAEPLASIGREPVRTRHDFLVDGTSGPLTEGERASRDVLELISEHYRIVVRASGTEAKLKYYFDFAEAPLAGAGAGGAGAGGARAGGDGAGGDGADHDGADREKAAARFAQLEHVVRADCASVYADLARRAGYDLSERALDLPDVMPVQEKAGMQ
jgi:phosphoglucomutase/phosphomannomutase